MDSRWGGDAVLGGSDGHLLPLRAGCGAGDLPGENLGDVAEQTARLGGLALSCNVGAWWEGEDPSAVDSRERGGGARHARGGGRGVVREGHWRGTWDAPRSSSRDRSSSGALWSAERRCRASEIRPAQIHESGQTESEKSKDRHGPTGLKLDRHSRITVKLAPPGSVSVPLPRATYTSTHAAQYRGTLDLGSARWIPTCSNPSASCTSALVSAA